jgi:hypothetical protein
MAKGKTKGKRERYNFSLAGLIFFGVPPPLQPVEGRGSVKGGKEKFVTSLAFRRATISGTKKQAQNRLKA